MRRLMSLDTRVTGRLGCSVRRLRAVSRMLLSGLLPGITSGSEAIGGLVWKNRRPLAGALWPLPLPLPFALPLAALPVWVAGSGRPFSIWAWSLPLIRSSRKRLTWRALRETSLVPFLAASSSSSTTIGMNRSCSSKRNRALGSCISTLVSRTKIFFFIESGSGERRQSRPAGGEPAGLREQREERVQRSEGLHRFQHGGRVALGRNLAPFLPQHALGVEQEGAAVDAHVLAAVHALFDPGAEGLAQLAVLVGQQGVGEAELGAEVVVRLHAVLGHADDVGAGLGELLVQRGEFLPFEGAARGVVLGIEVHHQFLALVVLGQVDVPAAAGGQCDRRQLVAGLDAHQGLLSPRGCVLVCRGAGI